jgi:transcriptional regulator with XRE-family HTH domain
MVIAIRPPRLDDSPVWPSGFGALLKHLRVRAGWSQNKLAREAGCDPAYVNKLERSAEHSQIQPSRAFVLAFADVLELTPRWRDELLVAAGYCPVAISNAGGWIAYIGQVRDATIAALSYPEGEH